MVIFPGETSFRDLGQELQGPGPPNISRPSLFGTDGSARILCVIQKMPVISKNMLHSRFSSDKVDTLRNEIPISRNLG